MSSAPRTSRPFGEDREDREGNCGKDRNDFHRAASRSAHRLAWSTITSTNSDETLLGPCFFLVFFPRLTMPFHLEGPTAHVFIGRALDEPRSPGKHTRPCRKRKMLSS